MQPRRTAARAERFGSDDDESKHRFAQAQHIFHKEQTPGCAPVLVQEHGSLTVVINPPQPPLNTAELDAIFALPYSIPPVAPYQNK